MNEFNSLDEMKDGIVSSCNEIFSKNLSIRFFIGYEKLIGSRCGAHLDMNLFNNTDEQEAVLEIFDEICSKLDDFCENEIKKSNFKSLNTRLYIEDVETYEELFYGEIIYNSIEAAKHDISNIKLELMNNGDYSGND